MADLIARLEAATGADRELDAEIALEAGWIRVGEAETWALPGEPDIYAPSCPRFTASVDAALTLVPEGLMWFVGHLDPTDMRFACTLARGNVGSDTWRAIHALAPIAICLAALRARERG